MQYHNVSKYIPSNAIKTVQYQHYMIAYDALLAPKKGDFRQSGQKKTARQAERAHTGKPKASRVTWGYGEDMIPFSQVCLRPKKWVIWA